MRKLILSCLLLASCSYNNPDPVKVASADSLTTPEFAGLSPEIWQGTRDAQGVVAFKGLPFAAPPVGDRRWQAPQAYTPTEGIRSAKQFAAACMQGPHTVNWYQDLIRSLGKDPELFPHPNQGYSEDCLYLNLWTPAFPSSADPEPKLPVMVWIHGGSNKGGWPFEPDYRGAKLAQDNLVVVSVAYRLGIFGYFSHPELVAEQGKAGNYGLLDLIASLRWIREHVEAFGGDPSNITVFGESAGAANIGYLLSSPEALGLFNRAIHQSAGYQQHFTPTIETQTEIGAQLSNQVRANLADLRKLPAPELQALADRQLANLDYSPGIGGHALPASPAQAIKHQTTPPVSLLIGTNANEGLMYLQENQTVASTVKDFALTASLTQIQQQLGSETEPMKMDRLITGPNMRCPSYEMASATQQRGAKAWVYHFNRVRTGEHWQSIGAYHGAEIPYVFDTHADWLETERKDHELTEQIQAYWVNFARTGDPNGADLPRWPAWGETRQALQLNADIQPLDAPDDWLCALLAKGQNNG